MGKPKGQGLNLKKLGVNIFGENKGWKEDRTPQRSIAGKLTHNPVTNVAGNVIVKNNPVVNLANQRIIRPAARTFESAARNIPEFSDSNPARFLNNAVIRPIKKTDTHIAQALQGNNPYKGSFGQQIGQFGEDVLNVGSVIPIGKGVQLANKGMGAVRQGAKTGAKYGAGFGAGYGGTTSLQEQLSPVEAAKTIATNTIIGGAGGGVLGGLLPAGGSVIKNRVRLNEGGGFKINNPLGAKTGLKISNPDGAKISKVVRSPLTGTQPNALYHGSTVDKTIRILNDGKVKASSPNSKQYYSDDVLDILDSKRGGAKLEAPSVSFSRQRNAGVLNSSSQDVKLVFDEGKLTQQAGKTKPYADKGFERSDPYTEAEQRLTGKDAPTSALSHIELGPLLEPEQRAAIKALAKQKGIKILDSQDNLPKVTKQLSGAAQQSRLSKLKPKPLDQQGSIRLPFGPKQSLHYSSSNGSTKVSGKANDVYKQLELQQAPKIKNMFGEWIDNPIGNPEGGYAKIPGGKRDPAPDLHPKQKEFINDYAEMLEGMGQGNGVNITADGRRISNNFRSPENKGKAMTKADWFDQARKDIESGKGAYGASDEFAKLPTKNTPAPQAGKPKRISHEDASNIAQTHPEELANAISAGKIKVTPKVSQKQAPVPELKVSSSGGGTPPPTPASVPKGSSANDYMDYIVGKHLGLGEYTPKVRSKWRPSSISAKVQEAYKQPLDKARDAANDLIYKKGLASENPITASVAEKPTLAFGRFGLKDSTRTALKSRNGQQENAGRVSKELAKNMGKKLQNNEKSLENIDRFFEEEDYIQRAYGKGGKLKLEQLAPEEREVVEQMIDLNKMRNDINLEIGKIDEGLHAKYADGTHSPRIYDLDVKKHRGSGNNLMDNNIQKKRVELDDIADKVFEKREASPVLRSMVRLEIALRDKATHDAMGALKKEGLIRPTAPNKNFTRLSGKKYGKFDGMYAYNQVKSELDRKLVARTKMGKSFQELVEGYQDSPLGVADRFFKSTKTTLSPGTFGGNVGSNILAFPGAAGVNPLTHGKNLAKSSTRLVKDAHNTFDRSIYEARKFGVGVDDTSKQLTGDRRVELSTTGKNTNTKNPYKVAGHVYGGVDRAHQLSLYEELVKRGVKPEVAARRTGLSSQDYGGVGRLFQNAADAPVLGKPFARFTPELLRIMKNNALYNPVGSAAKVGAAIKAGDVLSDMAGETPEERKARENAVGQTVLPTSDLPFVNRDIPLNFAVGDSSINIARATGFNYPMEPGGDARGSVTRQLNPMADLTREDAQGKTVFAPNQLVSSLTFRPIADQVANRDFMGREISDPENKTRIEGVGEKGKKYSGKPTGKESLDNRIRHLKQSYIPLANEVDAIKSASQGKKDYYGKERTVPQAIGRAVGLKSEKNDKEARQKRLDTDDYYKGEKEQQNKFLRENPDLKESYAKIKSTTRTRDTNTKTNDLITPEKWSIVKSDTSGRLYKQLKSEAEQAFKKDKRPIDPLFKLSNPERVKTVTELRSRPTGDDIEAEEILRATSTWYKQFEQSERDYYSKNSKFYDSLPKQKGAAKTNPRVQSYVDVPHPEQPTSIKEYYKQKDISDSAGKAYYNAHSDQLSADFKSYSAARLKEINAKRAIEGHSPITQEAFDNKTFGFTPEKTYSQSSSGSGSGRSRGRKTTGSVTKYEIARGAGGKVAKTVVKKYSQPSLKVAKKAIAKPKVSIKKALT